MGSVNIVHCGPAVDLDDDPIADCRDMLGSPSVVFDESLGDRHKAIQASRFLRGALIGNVSFGVGDLGLVALRTLRSNFRAEKHPAIGTGTDLDLGPELKIRIGTGTNQVTGRA